MSTESQYEVVWTPAPVIDAEADLPPRYELARDVGDGVLGPVFGVRDLEDGRRWARLELVPIRLTANEETAARLESAWRDAKKIVSAHVARVRDLGRLADGRWFVVSEWIDGESLRARLKRDGHLHARHALEIARQVLLGLESAHAHGLIHGGLGGDNVWLAHGAPKTDRDPHGTAVRLMDFAISSAVQDDAARTHASSHDDLVAVAALLDTMIAPSAEDSASAAAREFSARVRDSRISFESAREMREALEALVAREVTSSPRAASSAESNEAKSSALRAHSAGGPADRRERRWALPTVALLGAATLALIVWGWRERNEVEARGRSLVEERSRAETLSAQLVVASETAEAEAAAKAEIEARALAAQDATRAALAAEAERVRNAAAELTLLQNAREAAERELETARRRAEEAEKIARAAQIEAQPATRDARSIDAAIVEAESGAWDDVSRRLSGLEVADAPSAELCRDLAAVAAGLDLWKRTKTEPTADSNQLRAAEEALARAVAAHAAMPRELAQGRDHEGAVAPSHERVSALLEAMQVEFVRERSALTLADLEDWGNVNSPAAVQDPSAAFEHARRFGCEHLDELATRFASELRSWVVVDDALDVPLLQKFHQLGGWLEHLRSGAISLPEKTVHDLEFAEFAQRWHDHDFGNDGGLVWKRYELPKITSARREWKNELVLKWRLGQPDSGYPIRAGGLAIYRCVDPTGRVEFWRETPLSVSSASWRLRRERLAEDGVTNVGEGVLRIDRHGSRFDLAGSNLSMLDLRDIGASVLVADFPPQWQGELPNALAQSSEQREAFRTQRGVCLVTNSGEIRRWFHPRWGLVREESQTERGWFTRELVFAR